MLSTKEQDPKSKNLQKIETNTR